MPCVCTGSTAGYTLNASFTIGIPAPRVQQKICKWGCPQTSLVLGRWKTHSLLPGGLANATELVAIGSFNPDAKAVAGATFIAAFSSPFESPCQADIPVAVPSASHSLLKGPSSVSELQATPLHSRYFLLYPPFIPRRRQPQPRPRGEVPGPSVFHCPACSQLLDRSSFLRLTVRSLHFFNPFVPRSVPASILTPSVHPS